MPEDDDSKTTINPGYVLGQLRRAIITAREHLDVSVRQRAVKRIERWEQVLRGMLGGTIAFGERAPVQDIPPWVTLEVVEGGFATGSLLAGGALQPHELDLLARLHRPPDGAARAALNAYYLNASGQQDLGEMLRTGCYRINVSEEGALLVVAWLRSNNQSAQAQELIAGITPFFDRLRFYPAPELKPILPRPTLHRKTTGETVTALSNREPQAQVEQMMEALKVWQPLYDRAVSLFIETVEDDNPFRKYPADWRTRAHALLEEYTTLRKVHTLCRKPDRPKENFARLRGYMKVCIQDPAQLTPRDIGMIRHILRCYEKRHGLPGSEQFEQRRRRQAQIVNLPTHDDFADVLIARLEQFPHGEGIENLDSVVSPVANGESVQFKISAASQIPLSLVRKVQRSWEAPIEQLVEKGIIPSGEVLAEVLPQITSQVRGAGFASQDLRRLYGAIYSAFRRRRSLLLLNLEHQVRIEDLPWIAVLSSLRHDDLNTKEQARQTLEQVTVIAIESFPYAILPNKLLQELRALIASAGLSIPIVDELAADIFEGVFSEKFLQAAQIAAQMLSGTLYERYYGVPYQRVLQLDQTRQTSTAEALHGFAALCEEMAQVDRSESWSVSRNGKIIEQSQILTTHNLAPLFTALDLRNKMSGQLRELAEHCFHWMCRRQTSKSWKANLRMAKNTAYAWRQMVFYLSLLDLESAFAFRLWARGQLEQQSTAVRARLNPALFGLEWTIAGGTFDRSGVGENAGQGCRLLGWTTKRQ